jgi:hypothetical protein
MNFDNKFELNVLINLAAIDHIIEAREAKLIHIIGKANQLSVDEINEMIKHPEPISGFGVMTEDEKFDHLCYLVKMMKADGRIIIEEIEFCETIALRLGFKSGVIRELSMFIYSDLNINTDRDFLKVKAEKYFMR